MCCQSSEIVWKFLEKILHALEQKVTGLTVDILNLPKCLQVFLQHPSSKLTVRSSLSLVPRLPRIYCVDLLETPMKLFRWFSAFDWKSGGDKGTWSCLLNLFTSRWSLRAPEVTARHLRLWLLGLRNLQLHLEDFEIRPAEFCSRFFDIAFNLWWSLLHLRQTLYRSEPGICFLFWGLCSIEHFLLSMRSKGKPQDLFNMECSSAATILNPGQITFSVLTRKRSTRSRSCFSVPFKTSQKRTFTT